MVDASAAWQRPGTVDLSSPDTFLPFLETGLEQQKPYRCVRETVALPRQYHQLFTASHPTCGILLSGIDYGLMTEAVRGRQAWRRKSRSHPLAILSLRQFCNQGRRPMEGLLKTLLGSCVTALAAEKVTSVRIGSLGGMWTKTEDFLGLSGILLASRPKEGIRHKRRHLPVPFPQRDYCIWVPRR